ncbi:MAG TPA: NEW3 domain-containing protein, partial [Thermomicrobiales bacterium]|nr:NEW3 domain-containing protein [Thermomicrobiales bacterium]
MRVAVLSLLVGLLVVVAGGSVFAASPYPAALPDFAHSATVHDSYYGISAGQRDRPMLVILRGFTDLALPAGFDENWAQTTFFGGAFPSLANYFQSDSFGDLALTQAVEGCGTANNGVAVVTTDTRANFDGMTEAARNKASIDAANACVNFALFDLNIDGTITNLELVIMHVTAPSSAAENCGAARGVDAGAVDGKNFAGNFAVAMGTTATNLMTHIHEIAHTAMNMRDLYGFGVGALDISGPTCGAGNAFFMRTSAWQKLHWGWISPTVVVNDGYYLVNRADTSGQAYILYDYARGANDYFIVENRQQTANTYDASAADSGLVIWRIDDAQYNSADQNVRPIDIMRPDGATNGGCDSSGICYGGSNGDAWNPTDSATPQRTMSRTWRDGAASNVAVRAIGPSGDVIRAYFDVRGPGVLVDPTNAQGVPNQFDVTPEEANPVSFTVMNTGEATDSFNFSVVGLPTGWSSSTQNLSLGAGAGATANVSITVPADAATGVYTVRARGVSATDGTVATEAEFTVRVVLHQTGITYTGQTSASWGTPAGFAAQLSDLTDSSEVVDGASVTFTLSDGVNSQSVTVTSNASGGASASPTLTVPVGAYTLTISMPRHGKHDAASITVPYEVTKRPTAIVYSGDVTAEYSDQTTFRATLTDAVDGAPLVTRMLTFTLGTQSTSGVTNATGLAQAALVINQPAAAITINTVFAEDALYLGSTDSTPYTIEKEDLTFVYTGSTLLSNKSTATLSAQATQQADGSPGDLALAQAAFTLAPTLTTVPFSYSSG